MEVTQVNNKMLLVNFRGMIMKMTDEEYKSFVENLVENGYTD